MRRVPRGDRLLVRLRRDAVCPVGLSAPGPRAISPSSSRPTSSARRSIRPAAGSTASWRSARCCSATRTRPIPIGRFTPLPHPFRNCIVLGLMLGEDGQKMSKSKRNYREPNEIFDRYGADALRWYFFANQPPWTSIRYSEQAIKDSIPEFLLRLWNVYSFFVIYANIDGFDPAAAMARQGRPA